jgi:thiamine phosphate synthase YjbQ (UPF0047 family)
MTLLTLSLNPSSRYEAIDVRSRVSEEFGDVLERYRKAVFCSLHTTAGYLDQALTARLRSDGGLHHFFGAFRALFPPGAEYKHDRMELRSELSAAERLTEPHNADSHLTFIGSGLRNCVTHVNRGGAPVYFVDLDGVNGASRRQRKSTVLAYDDERVVERRLIAVPVSHHPVDSINLADPRSGFLEQVEDLLREAGLHQARVDITLDPAEGNAGLTVNEYETMLMKHDLAEVLHNPLKFAALRSRHMLEDPLAIPGKTVNYAKYDFVHLFNSLMEAFGTDASLVERMLARLIAVPARRFLRLKRGICFLATDEGDRSGPRLLHGRYQSPILVQWRPTRARVRQVEVALTELR